MWSALHFFLPVSLFFFFCSSSKTMLITVVAARCIRELHGYLSRHLPVGTSLTIFMAFSLFGTEKPYLCGGHLQSLLSVILLTLCNYRQLLVDTCQVLTLHIPIKICVWLELYNPALNPCIALIRSVNKWLWFTVQQNGATQCNCAGTGYTGTSCQNLAGAPANSSASISANSSNCHNLHNNKPFRQKLDSNNACLDWHAIALCEDICTLFDPPVSFAIYQIVAIEISAKTMTFCTPSEHIPSLISAVR